MSKHKKIRVKSNTYTFNFTIYFITISTDYFAYTHFILQNILAPNMAYFKGSNK